MDYIRVFAKPSTRVKARSKRGWTSPTPAQLAVQQTAARAKAEAEAKESHRRATRDRHLEFLYTGAKALPVEEQLDWLSQRGSPMEVTETMDRIAKEQRNA